MKRSDWVPPIALRLLERLRRDWLRRGSTGLNQLDLKLISAIEPSRGGFFIELGAYDGLKQSNTYKLQKDYGWTGLLIEPSPRRFAECLVNRSFGRLPFIRCAACVPFEYKERFVPMEEVGLMSVAQGLTVSDAAAASHALAGVKFLGDDRMRHLFGAVARPLADLLDEVNAPAEPDLLSLDVEGNELSVLEGINFDRHRPHWILVELRTEDVRQYLTQRGYKQHSVLSTNTDYKDVLFRS